MPKGGWLAVLAGVGAAGLLIAFMLGVLALLGYRPL